MCDTLREVAKKVGIKEVGERTSLLWKLSAKKRAGELCLDENMTGQITNRTQERKMGGVVGRCFADVQRESGRRRSRGQFDVLFTGRPRWRSTLHDGCPCMVNWCDE